MYYIVRPFTKRISVFQRFLIKNVLKVETFMCCWVDYCNALQE